MKKKFPEVYMTQTINNDKNNASSVPFLKHEIGFMKILKFSFLSDFFLILYVLLFLFLPFSDNTKPLVFEAFNELVGANNIMENILSYISVAVVLLAIIILFSAVENFLVCLFYKKSFSAFCLFQYAKFANQKFESKKNNKFQNFIIYELIVISFYRLSFSLLQNFSSKSGLESLGFSTCVSMAIFLLFAIATIILEIITSSLKKRLAKKIRDEKWNTFSKKN